MPDKIVNLGGTIEGFPNTPIVNTDIRQPKGPTPSITDLYKQGLSTVKPTGVEAVPTSNLYVGERYAAVRPGEDLEEAYAQQQSSFDKWKNGAIKMAGTAAASFVSGTAGLIYGIGDVFKTGKFSSLYNNDMTRNMDKTFIQGLEDLAPNYYTAKEKDADWWSPDNIWTANFFSDKLMKNLGYTVGALGGGVAWTKLLRTLGTTNALVRSGYGLEAVTAAEEAMQAVPKVNQFAAFDGAINSVAQKYLKTPLAKVLSDPERIIASTMGTFGEASLEALQNANEFRQKAIEQYIDKYGKNPTGADLEEIDDYVSSVGNFTWGMNTLLLTGTNYIQLPKILGSSNRADKMLLNQIEKKGPGAAFTEVVPSTKFGKVLQRSKDVSKLFFAPTEAFEEGAQFAIQVGTNDYFNRAFRNRQGTQDFLTALSGTMGNVLGKGVEDAISTKEGLESILIGGLSGGIQQARNTIREQGVLGTGGLRRANTDLALAALNQSNIETVLGDYARYIGIGIGSQKARQQAIVNNDKVSEKDFETDFTMSYIMPRVKYGKVDSIGEEMSYYSQQASTEEGFQQLVANGIVNAGETREDFLNRLSNITRITKNIDDLYDSLGRKYGNQPGYTPEILDKMVYSLAKIGSYDLRIPEVNNLLFTAGVNTQDILQSIIKENKPNKEATEAALAQINEMDVTSETKDDLKTALSDVIELGLRRKLFIDEYDAIKANPTEFQFKPDVEFGATEEVPVTVTQEETVAAEPGEQIQLFPEEKERKLEVGKEYFLKQPVRREDNTLTLSPKIKVLSQTLTGELEVQLPKGNVTFMTPEQFKTLDIAEDDYQSPELKDIMESAIDEVLSKPEFADITIPDLEDKLNYVNSLNNAALTDAIETEFNVRAEEYLKQQADLQANREKMNAVAASIKSAQIDLAATAGVVPTGNNEEDLMNTPKESPKKDASILFTSSSSASMDWNKTLAPNVTRYNEFVNKVKDFKNRKNIKVITVTQKQEAALGLSGLGELSFREGNFDTSLLNDPVEGFIGLVFVEDKKGERQFIDKNGNPIAKVGEQVDLNKVVFTSMPAAKLTNSKGEPRYRAEQKEQADAELAGYQVYRDQLLNGAEDSYQVFDFTSSKGIAITDDTKKSVGGILIPENQIATQQVLTVVTKGGVDHVDGITYKFPNGRPVFQSQDTLEFLNNSNLTKDQATAVYNVLKAMSNEAKQQIAAKKPVKFKEIYKRFLQGVTFYTSTEAVAKGVGEGSDNRIYIEGSTLHIGQNTYDFANLEQAEVPMISALQRVFHNVNSFTVNLGLGEPFVEFYVDDTGKLAQRNWKNYQSYLLASKNPDGSARTAPLTTNVVKPTDAVPYTHKQKYIILNGLELPTQSVAKPTEAGVETYKSNVGDVTYKVTTDTKGDFTVELVGENPNIQKIVDNPELMAVATQQLKDLGKFDELDEPIQSAAKFAAEVITAKLLSERKAAAPAPASVVSDEPKNINIGGAEYRRVGRTDVSRISDSEIALFKEWHAKNAKNIPYEILENVISINDTEKAWGAFENGVAKFFKGAQRGTEYHEIFEGIWKSFLSKGEQQAILDEFKSQAGSFLDRESGRRIDYADATDQQAKERIADDFAEFRLGKLPARNLKERVRNFFKALMEFFKSFVTKPSLKEDLFKSIDTGEFADRTMPESVKNEAAQYRKIEGINAKQTNEFVQDITARVFGEIFANNRSLFNIEDITASELFNRIREQYIKNNVIGDNPVTQISENQYVKLVERAKEFLKTYRIEFDENSRVTVNDDGANRRDYAAEAFTVNFKKSSPYAVKLLIGTLIKTKGLSREADTSSIGGLKLVPFNQAFTTLMSRLSNTRSVPEFVSKLNELAKENSDYIRLFERLGGNLSTGQIDFNSYKPHDIRLFTNFYQVFTKQRPDALAMFMDGNNVYTAPANQASAISGIRSEWIENMKTKAEQPGSIISYDAKKRIYTVKKADYNIKTPQDKVAFLLDLGIDFPMSIYNKVKNKKAFSEAVSGIKIGLSKTDELMGFGGRKLGIRTQLNELAKLYVVAASPAEDSTYFGVDGNRIQSDTDANYPSLLEYIFNSSDTLEELKQNMPQLNDVFSTNSQVLKLGGKFFDEEGNRIAEIKVQYIQGVKDVVDNQGTTTSSLSIGDRYITEINQNLDGRYYVLIPADSSREWMMDLGNTIAYTDVAAGNVDTLFTDTFLGYLKDEIKLAQDSTNRAKLRNVGDKATELRFLKDMLPAALLSEIQKLIDNRASEAQVDDFIAKNREDLNAGILKSLDDTVTKTRQNLVETQKVIAGKEFGTFIMPELENNFTDKAGLNKLNLTDQEVNDVIKFANANYMINNVEFHKVLFGDPYQFEIKGNQLDETKRIKSFLSPRRITLNTDTFNNLFNKQYNTVAGVQLTPNDYGYHEHKNFAKTFTAAEVEVKNSFYPKSKEADAASWIMDAAYKEVKLKNGQWSDEAEDWHQWQMAYTRQNVPGYTYSSDALRKHDETLLQQPEPIYVTDVLKPIVSGNKYGKAYIDLVLDKFSQMPLYYKAVEGTNLGKFYEKMFKEGYDYAVVVSGRKVGAEKLHKLYNEDGSFNEEAFNNTINVDWNSYGIQVENSYDKDSKQTLGSQLTKLSTVDLYNDGKALNEKAKQAVEKNTEVLKEMLLNGYSELLRKLGIEDLGDNFVITDNTTIANTLRQEMLKREMSENGIDSISVDPETGEFYIPFEASTNYIQIKSILYSIVDKSIVSPKVSGFPAVQVPVTMWEKAGESRGEGLKKSALKFYTKEDPYMEVYLPAWFKKQLPKGKTDEELIKLLEGSEILKGIGFRIPTQGLNSVEVFKIKGFLPEFMGKTIVVPSEITTKAGSDFDIDKLNLYLKNIYVTPSGEIKSVPFFGYGQEAKDAIKKFILEEDIKAMLDINSDISGSRVDDYGTLADKLYKQSLENEYFRSIEALLTLQENFDRLTSPNTDTTLKEIADDLDILRGENEGDIKNRLLDRNYMTNQRHAFLTGKRWIGIAAVNITGNSLAQKTNVFVENPQTEMALQHNKFVDGGFEHISLSGMKDQDGEYISDKLSMYANAFVDIAKDPYIMKIIYSNRVVGTFMLLERAGVPMKTVGMFMNQPIIREHIKNLDANSAPRYAISNPDYIKQAKLQFPASQKAIQAATVAEGSFEDNISSFAKNTMTETQNAEQHKILNEFLSYVTLADENFNFTQAINYDTTTFRNADDFYRKELMTDRAQAKGAISSPEKVLESSFLGTEKTVLDQSNSALGAILKFNQPEFRGVLEDTIQQYAEKFYIAKDTFNRVAEKASASLLDYILQTGRKNPLNISELSFGPESVAVKLEEAKQKYPNKQILQDLVVVSAERPNSPKTIKLRANVKEAYDENMYIGMMRELRDDPNTNQLYKDIIKAAIIQGTYQSAVSIKNIIPIEDYSTEVKNTVNTAVVDVNVREFAKNNWYQRNNWKNSDITPSITPYIDEESVTEIGEFKNQVVSQYKFTGFVEIPGIGVGENDKLVLAVGERSKAAGYDMVVIPRIITTKYGEMIDFMTGRTVTRAAYAEMKAKGDPMISQVFGYQKVKFVGGEALRTYKGKFVFKMVNLYGDGQFISEYYKFNKPSELDNNTGKVTDEIPNSEIIKYFTGIEENEVNSQPETETDLTTKDFKCKF